MKQYYEFVVGVRIVGTVMLYGDHDNYAKAVMFWHLQEALALAKAHGLDRIEIRHRMVAWP